MARRAVPKKSAPGKRYVLGFDGGGTKSICVIADEEGCVLGMGMSGGTNFQGVGVVAAGIEVKKAISKAVKVAGINPSSIVTAAYGVAGADRDDDFDTVASYILPHNPAGRIMLVNDTTIALRAGTSDGIGVALVSGTGSNCIGFNLDYQQAKVGGLGHLTGDVGYGEDLVNRAIVASMRSLDGRGPRTTLHEHFCRELELEHLEDIIVFGYADSFQPLDLGRLTPIVFDCAARGDKVAVRLLNQVGKVLAKNAVTACRCLFKPDDRFPVVLGGSILQKSKPPILVEAIKEGVAKRFPNARVVRLGVEPVLGAVFYALDLLHQKAGRKRMASVKKTYPSFSAR